MQLKKLIDTRLRILVSLYSSIFILADLFKTIFNHMMGVGNSRTSRITLNYNALAKSDLSKVHELVQITIVKYVAEDNKALLAKLKRDISSYLPLLAGKVVATRFYTLARPTFLEFAYPIRFVVFILGLLKYSPLWFKLRSLPIIYR